MNKCNGLTSSWDYIDFELEIRKGARRKYPVAVRSPEGEAQGEMRFPFGRRELKDKLKDLENAVLLSGTRRRRIRSPEAQAVQDFGQALFRALLQGEVGTHYELSLRAARRQNKGLRLKLHIQPPELTVLPWEFLYDPSRDAYLCLSSKTPLVRYLELHEPVEQLPVTPPLRILGMVASPSDLDPLDIEHEKRRVEEAIKDLQAQGRVDLTWLEGQTSRDLQRAMIRGPWHVFHFIGHGGFDPVTDEGLIALANEAGYTHFLPAEDLAQLLKDHWDLRLVVLNSCEGARGSEHDAFSSTAATLVRPGIPAVLANQYEITDEAAIEFSRTFYQAVADGLPVDAAVAYARTSLKLEIDNTLEWGTPVLYMRSPDGRIFDISTEVPPPKLPREPRDSEEEDSLRRYRECVKSVWADGELGRREVERLRDLADNKLKLSPSTTADIERDVMGDTKEVILERQERVGKKEYPEARSEAKRTKEGSRQSAKPRPKQDIELVREAETLKTNAAARRCAEELGVDLREVQGTGAGGRITVADVKKTVARKTGSRTSHTPQGFLPRSKRVILSVTAVGILLVLLTGGGAMAFTGIGPAAKLLRGPESQQVGESPPAPSADSQQDTAAGEKGTKETTSPMPDDSPVSEGVSSGDSIVKQDSVVQAKQASPATTLNEALAVPNLVGMTEDAAKQRVGSDFKIVVNARKASSGQPKGSILSQDPKPNEQARRSSTISVVVSSGPETTQGGTTAQKIGGLTNAKTPENPKAAQRNEELQDQTEKGKLVGEPDSVSDEASDGAGDAHRPEAEAK